LSPLDPPLSSPPLPPGAPQAAQAAAQAAFASAYQANLAALSEAGTEVIDGPGDVEFTAAWAYQNDALKAIAGASLAVPTGRYDPASTVNIGFGDFYTLRPGVMVAYAASESVTLGMRASLGFNTRNKDTDVRSGNYGALDLALAWRTPVGVVGPHVLQVKQWTDDSGGTQGANRFDATGVGGFYTTLVPGIEAALNLSYMKIVESRNALSGSFFQLRMSKQF
jgi:hypothetical protein